MRQHTNALIDVLTGPFERSVAVNVFHGTDRVAEDLTFEGWSLDADLGSEVVSSGSGAVIYPSVAGESLSPVGAQGLLSPFRARIELVMTISSGQFVERIGLGLFRVVAVPQTTDVVTTIGGIDQVVASRVELTFLSLDEDVRRASPWFPEQSAAGASAWEEIRRLTGLPVEESVPDVRVPSLKVHEAAQGGRLKAVHEMGKVLHGTTVINSRGAYTVVPDAYGDPVGTLRLGAEGTVTDIGAEITTAGVYNVVVGTFEDAQSRPFYAVAKVETGPLAWNGLYGQCVRYYASDLVKTPAQGQAAVDAVLAESIGSQMYDVSIQCHINPLVEVGDIWAVEGWTRPLVGRVMTVGLSASALMMITLRIKRDLT